MLSAIRPPPPPAKRSWGPGEDAGNIITGNELGQRGVKGAAAAAWLRAIAQVAARTPKPDLVWSGPEVPGLYARDTRRAYEELLGSAERSILASTYAFFDGRHHEFSGVRPFFCQVEAAETAIWLAEVAPQSARGKRVLDHLAAANKDANRKGSLPGLQWSILAGHHVGRNRGLGDIDAQFEQLPMDLGSAPEWVLKTHSSAYLAGISRAS